MPQVSRAVLKSYFETDDVPTQAQFIDLIDSILNFVDDTSIGQWTVSGNNLYHNNAESGFFGFSTNTPTAKIHAVSNGAVPLVSMGDGINVTGIGSIGMGVGIVVGGDRSCGIGDSITISAEDAFSVGQNNTIDATANQSVAIGDSHSISNIGRGWAFGTDANITDQGAMVFNTENDGAGAASAGIGTMKFQSSGFHFWVYDTFVFLIQGLPTSAAGLPSGALWRDTADSHTIKMVP